ncbi:DUF6988 family protein [Aeromonas veronii]|uniref:DUF6988 family protein n=1 Tax=Aeromonas veronii TaxID=654 RepID=UPI003A28A89A
MKNEIGNNILNVTNGMKVPNVERAMLSVMMHSIVFDSQRAIFDLVKLGHFTSALALLRVLFEAHVRGLWINSCASEKQIYQFKKDSLKSSLNPTRKLDFDEMVKDVERVRPHLKGTLAEFKQNHWKGLNSLTHSGVMQCQYNFENGEMRKIFSETHSETLMDFSKRFAIGSLADVGKITNDIEVMKMASYLGREHLGIG